MASVSVSLNASSTVHVPGTGPHAYPLLSIQFVDSLAVGGILTSDTSTTSQTFVSTLASIVRVSSDHKRRKQTLAEPYYTDNRQPTAKCRAETQIYD